MKIQNGLWQVSPNIMMKGNENKKLLKDIDLFDRLLSTLQNTVNKLISWVSSVFKVTEESLIDTFEKETNTSINLMEQLLLEDENLIKELEHDYE